MTSEIEYDRQIEELEAENARLRCQIARLQDPHPPSKHNEPPVGTWVKDRFGATAMRHEGGGWAPPGFVPTGRWQDMWEARGPLVICGPWGEEIK